MSALEIIKQIGIWELGDPDGCACLSFDVAGVAVAIRCHKTNRGGTSPVTMDWGGQHIRVEPGTDSRKEDIRAIAIEVARQLGEDTWPEAFSVRFCSAQLDEGQKCVYCGKPRVVPHGYLCAKCPSEEGTWIGTTVADHYDYTGEHFLVLNESGDGYRLSAERPMSGNAEAQVVMFTVTFGKKDKETL